MHSERQLSTHQNRALYFSLPRVRALELIWEDRDKVAVARGLGSPGVSDISHLTEQEKEVLRETAANLWACLEAEAQQGRRTDIEVAEGMAALLEGYRCEKTLLDQISSRVDELLKAQL